MELISIDDIYERLYEPEDMDIFLEDADMTINTPVYDKMTSELNKHNTKPFDEYFAYAYAVCAKLNTDKYPEAHFKQEYWDDLPIGDSHRLIILAIVYMLVAFNRTPRRQYPKMMRAIFQWKLEGKQAPYSHNLLKFFFPVIAECLKERKHTCYAKVPGEKLLKEEDERLLDDFMEYYEEDFTLGRPEKKEEAQLLMKEMQDCLLTHMMTLENELGERTVNDKGQQTVKAKRAKAAAPAASKATPTATTAAPAAPAPASQPQTDAEETIRQLQQTVSEQQRQLDDYAAKYDPKVLKGKEKRHMMTGKQHVIFLLAVLAHHNRLPNARTNLSYLLSFMAARSENTMKDYLKERITQEECDQTAELFEQETPFLAKLIRELPPKLEDDKREKNRQKALKNNKD